jgi:c-di-GMP-binding flagellar brake protein YcgR
MKKNTLSHNRRAHIRYDLQQEIKYKLPHNPTDKIFKGISTDISEAGLGLYAYSHLTKGQEITIMSNVRELNRKGIVCWCHELGDSVYRIGLMFTGA